MSTKTTKSALGRHQNNNSTESHPSSNGTIYSDELVKKPSFRHCTPCINPYVHQVHFSTWDNIKIYVMTYTILPIRALVAFSCLTVAWFIAFLCLLGRSKEDAQLPMTGWRNFLRPLVVFWARCMYFFGGFHWVTVKGRQVSSREAPILVVAPHSSFFDSLPITFLGLPSVVAKTSAQLVPFFGTLTKFSQPVFVSREDPNSRHNTIVEIRRRAATGGEWPQIVIFPEGTCTNRSCIISFKPGAFIPGVPVQPVCIKYPVEQDTVTWTWCGIGALKALYYTLCRFHTPCEIEFLPVYTPSEAEKRDAALFARNVRSKMAEALGVPITEHSYEDGEAMLLATELSLPLKTRLVNINMVLRQIGLRVDRELMYELAEKVVHCKTFWFNASQFSSCLSSYISQEASDQLFALFIEDEQSKAENVIDVRQCFLEMYLLSKPKNLHQVLQFAFHFECDSRKFKDDAYGLAKDSASKSVMSVIKRGAKLIHDASCKRYLTNSELCDLVSTLCHYDAKSKGTPTGHSFTYDEVKAFITSLNLELANALKEVPPPSDDCSIQPKCDPVGNGRIKAE